MTFIILINYDSPKYLHIMHNTIKNVSFILGETHEYNINDARNHQFQYLAEFFKTISEPYDELKSLPVEPETNTNMKLPYFCTIEPCSWKINVWKRCINKGYFYNSFHNEKLFSIEVTEIQHMSDEDSEDVPFIRSCSEPIDINRRVNTEYMIEVSSDLSDSEDEDSFKVHICNSECYNNSYECDESGDNFQEN